jgi:Protein of unknwon function (DUF3310)
MESEKLVPRQSNEINYVCGICHMSYPESVLLMKHIDEHHRSNITPEYYKGDYVMRIIEDFKLDFLTGTVIKYLLRAGHKGVEVIDLKKAKWYLERKIGNLEK